MYCVLYFTLEKKTISDWPKSGPVETGPTGPVATLLFLYGLQYTRHGLRERELLTLATVLANWLEKSIGF